VVHSEITPHRQGPHVRSVTYMHMLCYKDWELGKSQYSRVFRDILTGQGGERGVRTVYEARLIWYLPGTEMRK
jgi:hypothetical protein